MKEVDSDISTKLFFTISHYFNRVPVVATLKPLNLDYESSLLTLCYHPCPSAEMKEVDSDISTKLF